jgi:benzodiazapine receptor
MKKTKGSYFIAIFLGISLSLGVGFISSLVTRQAIPVWYEGLEKPFFSPPNWIFAPVWTLLYCLMGWAVGSVWHYGRRHRWGKTALYHFGAQLIFNGLWSLVFFGLRSPLLGLLVILTLWILIQRTIFWFGLVDKKAAYLLYPYLAWVSFATILNGAVLYLN